jgi:hypothetical protein
MVPVFKYLESKDIDEVGYTLRTASLMTDPEYYFDENNPSDYVLFGIRYLILPQGLSPPVPASVILRSGPYWLWTIKANGYLDVVETVGVVSENRADIASQSLTLLRTDLCESTMAVAPVLSQVTPRRRTVIHRSRPDTSSVDRTILMAE